MKHYLRIFGFVGLMFMIGCESFTDPNIQNNSFNNTANSLSKTTLPTGATVVSATLSLYIYEVSSISSTVSVHRITNDWTEFEASWDNRVTATSWIMPGGDYDATAIATFNPDAFGWKSIDITDLVNDWLMGPELNFGVLLKQTEGRTWYRSSEFAIVEMRPKVDICYETSAGLLICETIQRTGTSGEIFDTSILNVDGYTDANFGGETDIQTRLVNILDKRALLRFEVDQEPDDEGGPGTGTPGYWKTHPEAWPVEEITIGGITYTKDDAIELMKTPVKKDKTYNLFMHLVSSKLNLLIGNDGSCISEDIDLADSWMADYGPVGSAVTANSEEWQSISDVFTSLDEYNNGWLCAVHRD